jgi:hypothetical protein
MHIHAYEGCIELAGYSLTALTHGPGYYHVGSPADPGYAEQMRAMYGRETSSQGTGSQSRQQAGWQSRPSQSVPRQSDCPLIQGIPPTNGYSSFTADERS